MPAGLQSCLPIAGVRVSGAKAAHGLRTLGSKRARAARSGSSLIVDAVVMHTAMCHVPQPEGSLAQGKPSGAQPFLTGGLRDCS